MTEGGGAGAQAQDAKPTKGRLWVRLGLGAAGGAAAAASWSRWGWEVPGWIWVVLGTLTAGFVAMVAYGAHLQRRRAAARAASIRAQVEIPPSPEVADEVIRRALSDRMRTRDEQDEGDAR